MRFLPEGMAVCCLMHLGKAVKLLALSGIVNIGGWIKFSFCFLLFNYVSAAAFLNRVCLSLVHACMIFVIECGCKSKCSLHLQ